MDAERFTVGTIVGTHGLRGEVRVYSRTDFPHLRFVKGSILYTLDQTGTMLTLHVRTGRKQKNVYIVAFDEIVSIDMAEKLQRRDLFVTREQMPTLEEGQYLVRDLVGSQVITDDGQSFGVLTEVLSPGANDVYVVETKTGKEVLLPAIPECILEVDITNKKIIVHILPGLLDDSDEN